MNVVYMARKKDFRSVRVIKYYISASYVNTACTHLGISPILGWRPPLRHDADEVITVELDELPTHPQVAAAETRDRSM